MHANSEMVIVYVNIGIGREINYQRVGIVLLKGLYMNILKMFISIMFIVYPQVSLIFQIWTDDTTELELVITYSRNYNIIYHGIVC